MGGEHVCGVCDRGFRTPQGLRGHESLAHGRASVEALDLEEQLAALNQRIEVLEDLAARAYQALGEQRAALGQMLKLILVIDRVQRLEAREQPSPALENKSVLVVC